MPDLEGIAPIIPVEDVGESVAFFTGALGFELRNRSEDGNWALVARGEAGIMFVTRAPELDLSDPAAQTSSYVWVRGLDAYWDEVKEALGALPPERVRAPFTQAYGMREFHVAWGAFLLLFGEEATAAEAGAGT